MCLNRWKQKTGNFLLSGALLSFLKECNHDQGQVQIQISEFCIVYSSLFSLERSRRAACHFNKRKKMHRRGKRLPLAISTNKRPKGYYRNTPSTRAITDSWETLKMWHRPYKATIVCSSWKSFYFVNSWRLGFCIPSSKKLKS